MRRILIVGAGQSGLQLGLGLVGRGYDVTLMSARTPEEIRNGRVMSTQMMFASSLANERELGIDFWADQAPTVHGLGVSVAGPDGGRAIDWLGRLDEPAQSVDQRVKMAGWLEEFERAGGHLVIHPVSLSDLDSLTVMFDLTVVAAGKGELVDLFDRDAARSCHTSTQRALSVVYVHGLGPRPEHPDVDAVRCNLIPGIGELFVMPSLTLSGRCDILFFEGIPGGPLDCFTEVRNDPGAHLARTLELMRRYVPWEYERARGVELTDHKGTLVGGYPPVVRQPVGRLPSGRFALGMADVVVANDPITGQGSNNASKCAAVYLDAITAAGDGPLDEAFMRNAFESYWAEAETVTAWTNAMLAPPPPHVLEVLGAAGEHPEVADRFANGFDRTADFRNWLLDPDRTRSYLAEVTTSHAA
ncbi:styrene monooxygenase/indole monooxygenase family protein [Actinoalloteichus caeruleus]|uniref:2-polyprenyl-6-methoxyphenol hydroxylase n=1 Tax=Actinoalloteichus caeruleus DSM 43889 TaxID=1120930 RepID=A0ABT1JBA5_ACTCY|nr:styrene monooxygenase/indole monooxygenase family protein [Actinoalloteichus caeruleus]MCP2329777.1 2-polyprenyl-6-methoxyphenol hydroxylase [Actinoalloteichus caeruleus DSM 43889]